MKFDFARQKAGPACALDRNRAIDVRVQQMLTPRPADRGATRFVDDRGFWQSTTVECLALKEVLWYGGDVAPGANSFGRRSASKAKAFVSGDASVLPREEFPGEIVPFGLVHRAEQLPDPGAASGRLGEIAGKRHGRIKITGARLNRDIYSFK